MTEGRRENNGGMMGFIIRTIIISLIHSVISTIITLTTIDLYHFLTRKGYTTFPKYLIIILCNIFIATSAILFIILLMKAFNINLSYCNFYGNSFY